MKRASAIRQMQQTRVARVVDPAQESRRATDVVGLDEDLEIGISLPKDHPVWRRDRLSASARARRMLEKIVPIVIRVFSFWDHGITKATIDGRSVEIDGSGSYRVS